MNRQKRNLVLIFFPLFFTFTVFVALIVFSFWLKERSEGPPRAAIVDHLSLTYPNPVFVQNIIVTLKQAGYEVDYYPGEEVTVNFYRNIPRYGYKIIIFRVHSVALRQWRSYPVDLFSLFTSEPYNISKYIDEQRLLKLGIASYYGGGEEYFGVMPNFIAKSMRGSLPGATVIMMGCEGLSTKVMAQAFLQKGAKIFVGWDGLVSAPHTDAATERLLQYLLIEKLSIEEAVERTMEEIGPDPEFGSKLLFYPP